MDYSVGSVAALISGNVTPNRPKLLKRALTPVKHQPSPNVTPKSEFVDDRSIFLSPSVQKKKAIVKKSPKRIFQNPDLDLTNDGDGSSLVSPKTEKVKKHLKDDLEAEDMTSKNPKSPKSPKKNKEKHNVLAEEGNSKKKNKNMENVAVNTVADIQSVNESTPKKKKKQKNSISMSIEQERENNENLTTKKNKTSSISEDADQQAESSNESPKKKRKIKVNDSETLTDDTEVKAIQNKTESKKNKKKGNKKAAAQKEPNSHSDSESDEESSPIEKNKKTKVTVNPNAITNQDTDSEHDSDDEIQSDNDEINKEVLDTGPAESSDEEEEKKQKPSKAEKKERVEDSEEEVKRTLFVGNVPFSPKCKKQIKKIFRKYGIIDSIRIRNVPVKDARITPKVAVVKNELHPERSTVTVYVKFRDASSVNEALKENNTCLNDNYLRVTRSDSSGSEHDPHRAIFIGNLPFALEDDGLRTKFEKCGEITSVRIVRDRKTNAGKGFGYVNFASKDGVELALTMTEEDLTIKNRILRVKRCTMVNQKSKSRPEQNQNGPRNQNVRNGPPRNFGGGDGGQNRNFGGQDRNSNGPNRNFGGPNRNFGGPNRNFGGQNRNFSGDRNGQNFRNGPRNSVGQNFRNGPRHSDDQNFGEKNVQDGAHRRILKKRQNEDGSGGPPAKQSRNINQPRERKQRKEFVGMTSEKKKKHKFNKGQKQKKIISEILTK